MSKSLLAVALLGFMMAAVGCQSMGGMMGGEEKAVVATSSTNGTTVFLAGHGGSPTVLMSASGKPVCAQCMKDASEAFKTGNIAAVCSACGASRSIVSHGMK